MNTLALVEVIAAVALIGFGIMLYRKPSPGPDRYGSQGAVLMFAVAAILIVHVVMTARAQDESVVAEEVIPG